MTRETDRMEDVLKSMLNSEYERPPVDDTPQLRDCTAPTSETMVLIEAGNDMETEEVISCRNPVPIRQ